MAALFILMLIALAALGMTGLAAIELRRSGAGDNQAVARANARFALMLALGQLQRTLGPDQRVSAPGDIVAREDVDQPHWTGVWRSTREDGSPFFERDDLSGGLRDTRAELETTAAERVIEWLVSGTGDPLRGPSGETVSLGRDESGKAIRVPRVALRRADGSLAGRHAWWTGDLGVRANVATRDAWKPGGQSAATEPGKWFRVMTSQSSDIAAMTGEKSIMDEETGRLASMQTTSLTSAGEDWAARHVFNLTIDSQGVLADVANGGLKQDLTAFLTGGGRIPEWQGLPGLADDDPIIAHLENGAAGSPRSEATSPRFGLLRDWARLNPPMHGRNTEARLPETDRSAGGASAALALANEEPVKLTGNTRAGLQPVLVEATNFIHLSTFVEKVTLPRRFQLRHHLYPRVVLWNPYNVELDFQRAIIMIQGNGRQEMWTENVMYDKKTGEPTSFRSTSQWLSFEGGRSTKFVVDGGIKESEGYNDPYIGSYYFAIPATKFKPGECLVFSPARNAEYDCLSVYRPGAYNLNANELTCSLPPDPSRSYYISGTDINGGNTFRPVLFWYAPTPAWTADRLGIRNQADDTRAILKHVGDNRVVTFDKSDRTGNFDKLPQIAVVSSSLQYGAGREPRIAWSSTVKMPMELLDKDNPRPTVIPNVRTREGVRLRWFEEHPSNTDNSGALNRTPFMQEALLANWNPRASFVMRSPWENIGGELPRTGTAGGPWFFGAYTRDLFGQEVSWEDQEPVAAGGRFRGNPFGPPQEGADRHVLFDVPRRETGVVSLGQFQHAKLSELVWHPSYAIGNSLADPRLGEGGFKGIARTAAVAPGTAASVGGFHESLLGWSADAERGKSRDEWAATARAMLGGTPSSDNLVYDLSFEANHALWDRFFLSSGTPEEKRKFAAEPQDHPLPNGRMRLAPGARGDEIADDLTDFHKAASRLMVDGAFNVNSTRPEAWKALLASTRLAGYPGNGGVPFPRVLNPPGGAWSSDSAAEGDAFWAGHRELTTGEIDRLADAIVAEVKARGPFVSMADFVNRRLAEDDTGRMGALEAAIHNSGINSPITETYELDNSESLPDYAHPDHIPDSTRLEQTLKPASMAWGAPAWLTQGDLLQVLGPVLSARSDTFVIRAYGEAADHAGKVSARAWCEAVVQRTPEPLEPDDTGINPRLAGKDRDFGRRFIIQSFRWLAPEEV